MSATVNLSLAKNVLNASLSFISFIYFDRISFDFWIWHSESSENPLACKTRTPVAESTSL